MSSKVQYEGNLYDYYFGTGIHQEVRYKLIKYIIVKKSKDLFGDYVAIDLKSKKKYLCKLPIDKGELFVPPEKMIPFDAIYPDEKPNLQKRKILKMGNNAIEEIIRIKNEEKNKEE